MGNSLKWVPKLAQAHRSCTGEALSLIHILKKFVNEVSLLTRKGMEIIVVTSGAVAAGLESLGISKKPDDLTLLQAAASIGQVKLMSLYSELFSKNNIKIGQILLTHEDTTRRQQYLNISNTIRSLISLKAVSYTHLDVYKRQVWIWCFRKKYIKQFLGYKNNNENENDNGNLVIYVSILCICLIPFICY